jgi:glycosyltransferase involved in cell wall biosynthesis
MYSSIIVCGCTKNSAIYIHKHLQLLYDMAPLFQKFKMLIYENNSTDNTVEMLELFKQTHPNFDYITENLNVKPRTETLAHGRNTLLRNIQGYEYMIMTDLDDVIATFKPSQIKYLFENTYDEWDGLLANCLGKYYDIWALRIERDKWTPLCPFQVIDYDCWEKAQEYRSNLVVSQHQISIPVSTPLIPVTSAFGGFGIYKVNKINGRYNGFNGRRCEHVEFHRGMKRLFICPKFLVNKQGQHVI